MYIVIILCKLLYAIQILSPLCPTTRTLTLKLQDKRSTLLKHAKELFFLLIVFFMPDHRISTVLVLTIRQNSSDPLLCQCKDTLHWKTSTAIPEMLHPPGMFWKPASMGFFPQLLRCQALEFRSAGFMHANSKAVRLLGRNAGQPLGVSNVETND